MTEEDRRRMQAGWLLAQAYRAHDFWPYRESPEDKEKALAEIIALKELCEKYIKEES